MAIDESPDVVEETSIAARAATWVRAAGRNENFQVGGTVLLTFLAIGVVVLHGTAYATHVLDPIAAAGAVVALLLSVAGATATVILYGMLPRASWLWIASPTVAVVSFFAVLPPITAGYGWLTVLLSVLITLVYEATAAAWLVIARPWTWMRGASG